MAFDDRQALQIVSYWKRFFPDAAALPGIGLPSQGKGVLTMTHTLGTPPMTINGLPSQSPLANNALYSAEQSQGQWLNLYEIMLPDIPGQHGSPSSVQSYVNFLEQRGISIAGNHYHWSGGLMMGKFPIAVHSQAAGMDPLAFSRAHVEALNYVLQRGMGNRHS